MLFCVSSSNNHHLLLQCVVGGSGGGGGGDSKKKKGRSISVVCPLDSRVWWTRERDSGPGSI